MFRPSTGVIANVKGLTVFAALARLAALNNCRALEIAKSTVLAFVNVPNTSRPPLRHAERQAAVGAVEPDGVALPKSEVPEVQVEKPKVFAGTTRKKIRYGPHSCRQRARTTRRRRTVKLAGMADE